MRSIFTFVNICRTAEEERIPYNFLEEPDSELKCVICLEVARDPHQHEECGKLVCMECLERYGRVEGIIERI